MRLRQIAVASYNLNECERINAISPKKQNDMNIHYMPELLKLLELIKESKHKFYFYFTETLWNMPNVEEKTIIHGEEVQLNLENTYWFWNICMKKFFEEDLDNVSLSDEKLAEYWKNIDNLNIKNWKKTVEREFKVKTVIKPCFYPYPDYPQLFKLHKSKFFSSSVFFICKK